MRVIDCQQGAPDWFASRMGLATASNFGAILATIKSGEAADRRNYRARLVVERLTGRPIETYTNAAMQQGIEREPMARAAYELQTGAWVDSVGFIRHDTLEAGCSPDGLIGGDGMQELKCPQLATHLEYLRLPDGACPAVYKPQVQGQMWIAERAWCDFVSFNPDFPENLQLVIRRVVRDETYIAGLALAVELFMGEVREETEAMQRLAA